jgi:hypothetical protein
VRLHRGLPELHEARQAEPGVPAVSLADLIREEEVHHHW